MKEGDLTGLLDLAHKMAERSPVRRFQTGAVIMKNGEIISTGWSHASERNMACYRSMHAELHAIFRCDSRDTVGSTIAIVTLSRKSGNRTDGTPCLFCLRNIQKFGIDRIICSTSGGGVRTVYPRLLDMSTLADGIDLTAKKLYIGHKLYHAC